MSNLISERYPLSHHLEDGASITMSQMSVVDREQLSKFVARLTRNDLLYLQIDITKPDIQDRWFDTITDGNSFCICAYDPARLVGYASVQIPETGENTGEIRVNIDRGYRSRGLGRALTEEIFFIAKQLNLEQITARMMADQIGATSAFSRLGFRKQQVLENHVTDANGEMRDLLVMAVEP